MGNRKHLPLLVSILIFVFIATGCQSSSNLTVDLNGQDIFKDYVQSSGVEPLRPLALGDNLFLNPDFELGLQNWTSCKGTVNSLASSTTANTGNSALSLSNDCFYQSVIVNPSDVLKLSCYVKDVNAIGWTGMGITTSDTSWRLLSDETPVVISGSEYTKYEVTTVVPENAKYASMWLYSEGSVLVDTCELVQVTDPLPPIDETNLLSNGDLEALTSQNMPKNWYSGCAGSATLSEGRISAGSIATSNAVTLKDGACFDQTLRLAAVNTLAGAEYALSCYVKYESGYADLNLFIDGQAKLLSLANLAPSTEFQKVELKGIVPNGATSGFVSLYSEGTLTVDDCRLEITQSTTSVSKQVSKILEVSGRNSDDGFGTKMVIKGDLAFINAPSDNPTGTDITKDVGALYIFQNVDGGWLQSTKLTPESQRPSQFFGGSFAYSDGLLAVTTTAFISGSFKSPSVFFYKQTDGGWELVKELTFENQPGGLHIQLDSNWLMVSGFFQNGKVLVYRRSLEEFSKVAELKESAQNALPGTEDDSYFGGTVILKDNTMLITNVFFGDIGFYTITFYVYRLVNGTWIKDAEIQSPVTNDEWGGGDIVFDGQNLIFGFLSSFGGGAGRVFAYSRDTSNTWVLNNEITPSNSFAFDDFGSRIELVGESLYVSSPAFDQFEESEQKFQGVVYKFEQVDGNWIEIENLTAADGSTPDFFGASLAGQDGELFIANPNIERFKRERGIVSGSTSENVYIYNTQP